MDWLCAALTVIQMQMIACRMWQGWIVALVNSCLWTVLSYQQGLWGLVALQLVLSCQFSLALVRWARDAK